MEATRSISLLFVALFLRSISASDSAFWSVMDPTVQRVIAQGGIVCGNINASKGATGIQDSGSGRQPGVRLGNVNATGRGTIGVNRGSYFNSEAEDHSSSQKELRHNGDIHASGEASGYVVKGQPERVTVNGDINASNGAIGLQIGNCFNTRQRRPSPSSTSAGQRSPSPISTSSRQRSTSPISDDDDDDDDDDLSGGIAGSYNSMHGSHQGGFSVMARSVTATNGGIGIVTGDVQKNNRPNAHNIMHGGRSSRPRGKVHVDKMEVDERSFGVVTGDVQMNDGENCVNTMYSGPGSHQGGKVHVGKMSGRGVGIHHGDLQMNRGDNSVNSMHGGPGSNQGGNIPDTHVGKTTVEGGIPVNHQNIQQNAGADSLNYMYGGGIQDNRGSGSRSFRVDNSFLHNLHEERQKRKEEREKEKRKEREKHK